MRRVRGGCGLIPARAGTTLYVPRLGVSVGAHPRSRGDHTCTAVRRRGFVGSSPLARGPRYHYSRGARPCGLIPARAGTTRWSLFCGLVYRAHPRSRGDHLSHAVTRFQVVGSSPLARGPQCTPAGLLQARGLIPARAGTTKYSTEPNVYRGAHPRSRGDHSQISSSRWRPWGSSPLARGPPVLHA